MAKVSIMRLIQRSCTALVADSSDTAARAVTNVMMTTVPLQILERAKAEDERDEEGKLKHAPSLLVLVACDCISPIDVEPVAAVFCSKS